MTDFTPIVRAVQDWAGRDDLHKLAFAKWFYEQATPEAKAQALIPSAIARWAGYEPEIVLEIVYRLLDEINYHPEREGLQAIVEGTVTIARTKDGHPVLLETGAEAERLP